MTESGTFALGPVAAIPPGEGREYDAGGTAVAVFRLRSGAVYATQALCPHKEAPLCDGLTGGTTLVCPFHSWKFDLATGVALLGTCGLRVYPAAVGGDGVLRVTVPGAGNGA